MPLILDGTNGISDVRSTTDGSAATPAIRGTDTNTGMFFPAADTIAFGEGGVESMRIDASGNVGIGTASPGYRLHAVSSSNRVYISSESTATTAGPEAGYRYKTANREYLNFCDYDTQALRWYDITSAAERMRITSAGKVGIGVTSPQASLDVIANINSLSNDGIFPLSLGDSTTLGKRMVLGYFPTGGTSNYGYGVIQSVYTGTAWTDLILQPNGGRVAIGGTVTAVTGGSGGTVFAPAGAYGVTRLLFSSNNSATVAMLSFDNTNGNVGSIGTSGSNAYYATTSDYRLKKNIVPMTGALDKVAILKPCTYTWKSNNEDSQGFIAHELAEICPQAVIGEKDAVDTEGNPVYQSIDTSFLVATLTAAIQEQQAIINDLKSRIETLEST
jgi:hypothetical protein